MPRTPPCYIRIMLSLYMWFCDHSEWWAVWLLKRGWGVPPVFGENPTCVFLTAVGGRCCSTLGGGFDLWGGWGYSHTCVYLSTSD
jgi:hypothetical protein